MLFCQMFISTSQIMKLLVFVYIYQRNPSPKTSYFVQWMQIFDKKPFRAFVENYPQKIMDFLTFTKEILNKKLQFMCSDHADHHPAQI